MSQTPLQLSSGRDLGLANQVHEHELWKADVEGLASAASAASGESSAVRMLGFW